MYQVKDIEKKKGQYQVTFLHQGETFSVKVSDHLILEYRLVQGKMLDKETYQAFNESLNHDKYRQKLLHYCQYKPRSVHEARQYLSQFDLPEKAKASYLDKMKSMHLLDDDLYAKNYVEEYSHYRMMGPIKIAFDLKQKGIHPSLVDKYLSHYHHDLVKENIYKWIDKKLKTVKSNKSIYKIKSSLKAYIANKGFDISLVHQLIESKDDQFKHMIDEDKALQKDFDHYLRKYKKSNQSQNMTEYILPKLMQKGYAYHKIKNLIEGEAFNES